MLTINLIVATKIVLSGFFIYRVQRFLRTHKTWELSTIFLILSFVVLLVFKKDLHSGNIRYLLSASFTLMVCLMAFEPEIMGFVFHFVRQMNTNASNSDKKILSEIAKAAHELAITKTGALIAFERNDSLLKYSQTGIQINADIKRELLTTLFTKDTPTHDGGILIRKGRATHCGAVFPLSERKQIEDGLGTRHRAGLGLTEKTDAVCLIVSEEEGTISLAKGGELFYSVPPKEVEAKLRELLSEKNQAQFYPFHYFRTFAPKISQPAFAQFSKSLSQKLYDLIAAIFWLSVFFLWNSCGVIEWNSFSRPLELFFTAPWAYAPFALLGLNLGELLTSQKLIVDGINNLLKRERCFFFIPVFRKQLAGEKLKAVLLKRESAGRDLWTLSVLNGRKKSIFLDRSTSAKTLADSARKIRDVLRLELVN